MIISYASIHIIRNITKQNVIGRSYAQESSINWSKRYLGRVALIQTITKIWNNTLIGKANDFIKPNILKGPPRK